jgi:hypothetical protein
MRSPVMDPGDRPEGTEVIVVSSETRKAISTRVFTALFFNGLAAGPMVIAYVGPKPLDAELVGLLIGWHALILAVSLFLMWSLQWGTWRIDFDGVTFEPCHGTPRRLEWSEVERVYWSTTHAKLRGAGKALTLCWHSLTDAQAQLARDRVAKVLSSNFDLGTPLPSAEQEQSGRGIVKRWAALLTTVLMLAVPWAAVAVSLAWRYPSIAVIWLFTPLVAVYLYAFVSVLKERWEIRRVHPAWPWRVRLKKSTDDLII